MNSQRGDTQKKYLIEEGKKIGTDEVIKQNETTNKNLKFQVQKNKCRKNTKKHKPSNSRD